MIFRLDASRGHLVSILATSLTLFIWELSLMLEERAELENADFRRNSELVSARTELPEQSEFASGHSIQW